MVSPAFGRFCYALFVYVMLSAPRPPQDIGAPPPQALGDAEASWLVKGFWFFLAAAAVGGVAVWLWKGPAAGAATAWFISPIPPPPLSPI